MTVTEVAQIYLGNINHSSDLAKLIETKSYLELSLSPSDRNKGRIHGYTNYGVAVGIIKDRDRPLRSGDLYQTDSDKLLLIELQLQELLVIDLATIENLSPHQLVQLGHVLGNHHYPIAIEGDRILVQLATDKSVIEQLINNLNIPGLKISYQTKSANSKIMFSQHSH